MGIFSRCILITCFFSAGFAFAKDTPFLYTNPIEFTADILPRRLGLHEDETRRLRFVRWVALNDRARIGLTPEGQVYGAVDVVKQNAQGETLRKNFAYLLSGHRIITEISIDREERLWAVDSKDKPLIFDDEVWLTKPLRSILKRTGRNFADELVAFTVFYMATKNVLFENWDLQTIPTLILGGFAATGVVLIEAWKAIVRFGDHNQFPDGFRIVTSDDLVAPENATVNQKLYDRTCELELVPWPVDHSQWQP